MEENKVPCVNMVKKCKIKPLKDDKSTRNPVNKRANDDVESLHSTEKDESDVYMSF
jgi:hypothetical protein